MEYTKDYIKEKLSSDVRWMERAILLLFTYQTTTEQQTEETMVLNGVGFNSSDSRYLTYVAKYLQRGGHLSGRHLEKVSKKLPKYWRQIQVEIESKQTQ